MVGVQLLLKGVNAMQYQLGGTVATDWGGFDAVAAGGVQLLLKGVV